MSRDIKLYVSDILEQMDNIEKVLSDFKKP